MCEVDGNNVNNCMLYLPCLCLYLLSMKCKVPFTPSFNVNTRVNDVIMLTTLVSLKSVELLQNGLLPVME